MENLSPSMERTLRLLLKLLCLQSENGWKVIQLSCITLWNISCRSKPAEHLLAHSGVSISLLDIALE